MKYRTNNADIVRLVADNTVFDTKNGFATMTVNINGEQKSYERVFFHRSFPFELMWEYISVLDENQNEIGIIYNITDFSENQASIIKSELDKKYYQPVIESITSLKERYGFSYWQVKTKDGQNMNFTVKDTLRSIIRVGENKAIVLDVDGNRFVIESIAALDKKSHRRIELYL